jgi:hypothetical protein
MTPATGLYEWLVFGHLVAAMVWLGGGVLLGALALRVLRSHEPEEVERFLGHLRVIGPAVLALRQFGRWCWGYGLIVVLLVVATWDMVNKPGL